MEDSGYSNQCVWDWTGEYGKQEGDWDWGSYEDVYFTTTPEPIKSPWHAGIPGGIGSSYLRDNRPEDGWVLVKKDFGSEKIPLKHENPYFVIYNRFTGILIFFIYINNLLEYDTKNTLTASIEIEDDDSQKTWLLGMKPYRLSNGDGRVARDYIGTELRDPILAGITNFGLGQWAYASYYLEYDPTTSSKTSPFIRFIGGGVELSTIEITGTLNVRQDTNFTMGSPLDTASDVFEVLGKGFEWATGADKITNYVNEKVEEVDALTEADEEVPAFSGWLKKIKDDPLLGFAIEHAAAFGFVGGMTSGLISVLDGNEPTLLYFSGTERLSGTMRREQYEFTELFRIPGTLPSPQGDPYVKRPDYDMPLGVLTLLQTPVIVRELSPFNPQSEDDVQYRYRSIDDLKIAINPNSGLRLRELYGALVLPLKSGTPGSPTQEDIELMSQLDFQLVGSSNRKVGIHEFRDWIYITKFVPYDRFDETYFLCSSNLCQRSENCSVSCDPNDPNRVRTLSALTYAQPEGVIVLAILDPPKERPDTNSPPIVISHIYPVVLGDARLLACYPPSGASSDEIRVAQQCCFDGPVGNVNVQERIDLYLLTRTQEDENCIKKSCLNCRNWRGGRWPEFSQVHTIGNLTVGAQTVKPYNADNRFAVGQELVARFVQYKTQKLSDIITSIEVWAPGTLFPEWKPVFNADATGITKWMVVDYSIDDPGADLGFARTMFAADYDQVKAYSHTFAIFEPGTYRVIVQTNADLPEILTYEFEVFQERDLLGK